MKLFMCGWMPALSEPRGLVFLCHGYGLECSVSMRGYGIRLVKAGYAVYGIDYIGHGKSSGLQCYIPNFDDLVTDCSDHFTSIYERQEKKNIKKILMGGSMGGAIALLLHMKKPDYWDLAVLVAPMCKIAEELKPHPLLIGLSDKLSHLIPTWKITPSANIIDAAFRVPQIRDRMRKKQARIKGIEGWSRDTFYSFMEPSIGKPTAQNVDIVFADTDYNNHFLNGEDELGAKAERVDSYSNQPNQVTAAPLAAVDRHPNPLLPQLGLPSPPLPPLPTHQLGFLSLHQIIWAAGDFLALQMPLPIAAAAALGQGGGGSRLG
ncbi:alpha/beta-Hydrolases superfamily protein [Perilla frutescens var. frutescens]|nr:alpha/beta-Hydrolases superfamily protein [Perilla frutescens var. frutescens]